MSPGILGIFSIRTLSKVTKTIVMLYSIYMIELLFGELSMGDCPRKAVAHNMFSLELYIYIPTLSSVD